MSNPPVIDQLSAEYRAGIAALYEQLPGILQKHGNAGAIYWLRCGLFDLFEIHCETAKRFRNQSNRARFEAGLPTIDHEHWRTQQGRALRRIAA